MAAPVRRRVTAIGPAVRNRRRPTRIAAITMVRNESSMLPRWVEHYAKQLGGHGHLLVIDDNSDDGCADDLPCPTIKVPPFIHRQFEPARLGMISHFASGLLESYDAVLFTDADEFLLADPDKFDSLLDLVAAKKDTRVFGAMGLNVVQDVTTEPELDPALPLLAQRKYAKFISLMCKPAIKKVHNQWTASSHGLKKQPWTVDPDLYMFHAKFADRETLRRAAELRKKDVKHDNRPRNTNWRFGGDAMVQLLDSMSKDVRLDRLVEFDPAMVDLASVVREEDETFRARGGRQVQLMKSSDLVLIPERFRNLV